jgi:cell division protein ZapE
MIEKTLVVAELNASRDYRLGRSDEGESYLTPVSKANDAEMDRLWRELCEGLVEARHVLHVFGRELIVKRSVAGAARFSFSELCEKPLAAADYLAIAHAFHTVMIDHVPQLSPNRRNEARRFVLLIDTLYDEGIRLICSAAALPDDLYPTGDGAEAFRRTASRLNEMRSSDYRQRSSSAVR